MPLARNIADTLSMAFGTEVTFPEHQVLKGDFALQLELATQACGGPAMSPNEARRDILGRDDIDGGDALRPGTNERRDGALLPTGEDNDR